MRKTKIICTLGPATEGPVLAELMKAGMNVARLNFSHGNHEEHKARMDAIKETRRALGVPVGIMLDTKGPEIRIKTFQNDRIDIQEGQAFTLTTRDVEGDESIVSITYTGLPMDVKVGTRLLIDDGLVAFDVTEVKNGTDIVCRALNNGPLSNRKSVNVPGIKLNMPYLSEKDKSDIEFGLSQDIDFIAASFCRTAQDVRDIKGILKACGKEDVEIIAKIENMEGVRNVQEILDEANGVMVARGDLGVEVPFEELPEIQKCLIKTCISRGKRVVTATQMLESMAKNPRPTRAEVSDVANAVYDGTSAIMLSGETSVGKYPVETVRTMSMIAENAERTIHYDRRRTTRLEFQNMDVSGDDKTNAIAHATCSTSHDLGAKCIVAFTESGSTARAVSTYRPGAPIVGATPSEKTFHRLTMSWGVIPILVPQRPSSGTQLFELSAHAAVKACGCKASDIITVTAGMPVGKVNYTNTLRVLQLTEQILAQGFRD
ncbi:pyruvate kinase [Butyricicoccus faecihominis]|uniref:pyruvate kinase n=1 Tax=Butyricicoccaceae TaxID=3085642 RepID=UPI00247A02F5|nr:MULTISPECIES: pyruvate kinase [Butyricicoccaceae]MCQ5130792.1 pyruvate kinase [Butyricicoccus faecihominis]WNX85194.1 pyruvate kinase [Agathobaculum sp. NTUH-O15-33]